MLSQQSPRQVLLSSTTVGTSVIAANLGVVLIAIAPAVSDVSWVGHRSKALIMAGVETVEAVRATVFVGVYARVFAAISSVVAADLRVIVPAVAIAVSDIAGRSHTRRARICARLFIGGAALRSGSIRARVAAVQAVGAPLLGVVGARGAQNTAVVVVRSGVAVVKGVHTVRVDACEAVRAAVVGAVDAGVRAAIA